MAWICCWRKAVKIEDMTREQLIALVKQRDAENSQLKFQVEQAWSRYEQANKITKSYMDEFAARGLMYIPKEVKGS
jgi:hypothetical protein